MIENETILNLLREIKRISYDTQLSGINARAEIVEKIKNFEKSCSIIL